MIARAGRVFKNGIFCGRILQTDTGYRFEYDPDYVAKPDSEPASLTLPTSKRIYESRTLFSFFDGLIPEGWLLNVAVETWKIPERDRFGLLLALCRDCIGDVSIEREEIDA